jgi:hypothetical protein
VELEVNSHHWHHRLCAVLGVLVYKQCVWNTVVYDFWRCDVWYLGSCPFTPHLQPGFLLILLFSDQAAALWVSEAAIGVGYPEESRKGLHRKSHPVPYAPHRVGPSSNRNPSRNLVLARQNRQHNRLLHPTRP